MGQSRQAVFFDLDGTLTKGSVLPYYMFHASATPSLSERLLRLGALAAQIPLLAVVDFMSRRAFQDAFYRNYRGLGRDQLEVLADEMFERVTKPRIRARAAELARSYGERGFVRVIVSGALDFVVRPVARYLGFDHVLCNSLAFSDDFATGALAPPVIGDATRARAMLKLADELGLDLARSHAYGDSIGDVPMLALVGQPFAVSPDLRLRLTARANGWPILDM
jgi:HAD superfamily hydrolase (TIGR01490 family)